MSSPGLFHLPRALPIILTFPLPQVIPAVGHFITELADTGRHPPGLRGLPHLRRGEGEAAPSHQQARQLRLPAVLHQAGPVGHRLRGCRREHPADNPSEQVTVPSPAGRLQRGIVSWLHLVAPPSDPPLFQLSLP